MWWVLEEAIPGVEGVKDWSYEKWGQEARDSFHDLVSEHATQLASIQGAPFDFWKDALDDEHRRLNNVEQKARVALGATSVVLPLTVLLLGQSTEEGSLIVTPGLLALLYLVWAFVLGLRANAPSARVYVGPGDYLSAQESLPDELRSKEVVAAAVRLAARDHMAELNRFKVNAADTSLRALRNGLVLLAVVAFLVAGKAWGL